MIAIFFTVTLITVIAASLFYFWQKYRKNTLVLILKSLSGKLLTEVSRLEKSVTNRDLVKIMQRLETKIDALSNLKSNTTYSENEEDLFSPNGKSEKLIIGRALEKVLEAVTKDEIGPSKLVKNIRTEIESQSRHWDWDFLLEISEKQALIDKLHHLIQISSSLSESDLDDPSIFVKRQN